MELQRWAVLFLEYAAGLFLFLATISVLGITVKRIVWDKTFLVSIFALRLSFGLIFLSILFYSGSLFVNNPGDIIGVGVTTIVLLIFYLLFLGITLLQLKKYLGKDVIRAFFNFGK